MSTRVRFAPSPTGVAAPRQPLSAVANRRRGEWLLLRIDDTDRSREVEGAVEAVLADLEWLGLPWNEGPSRQSERVERHREAALGVGKPTTMARSASAERPCSGRTDRPRTTSRASSTTTTSRSRTSCAGPTTDRTPSCSASSRALGFEALPSTSITASCSAPDGKKLSKREGAPTLAQYRDAGVPAEALRAYLEELGEPARRASRRAADPAAGDRRDQGALGRGAGRAGRGAAAARPRPSRRPRPCRSPRDGDGDPRTAAGHASGGRAADARRGSPSSARAGSTARTSSASSRRSAAI